MPTNTSPPPRSPAPALTCLGAHKYRLHLAGRFDPGWICGLSHGLAEKRINILRVEAARDGGRQWQALLDLDFQTATVLPDQVDYPALSRSTPTVQALAMPLRLDDYQIERSTEAGGSLYCEASGPDRIGALSSLLNTFSLFSLFPAKLLVETRNRRIFDRFWLKGLGGSTPSPEAAHALKERMREFVESPAKSRK